MDNVIDFTARRLAKKSVKKKAPTISEVTADAVDYLLGDWEKMARLNRLNDYFKTTLPGVVGTDSTVNFMSDLTQLASVELKLDIFPMLFFPGTLDDKQLGWIVQYKLGGETIATPELASECYARAFGILMYLRAKRGALDSGAL